MNEPTNESIGNSWLGDAGHYRCTDPGIFINNPLGLAFQVTVHRFMWPMHWEGPARITVKRPDRAKSD